MTNLEFKNLTSKLLGMRLTWISLACEMLMFTFGNYAIHTQCLTRIIKGNDILVTTLDYQSWDGEDDKHNDEWYNLEKYKPIILGGKITSVELNSLNDLIIILANQITIQIFIQNSYAHYDEEREQYRFYEIEPENEPIENKKQRKHYVVYNKHIED